MKRFIPTIILVILCIGVFWYASSQSFFKEVEEVSVAQKLAPIIPEEVVAIKITVASEVTKMELKNDQWEMTQPTSLPLETYAAESWLNAFAALAQEGVVEANPSDLTDFGLMTPTQEYEVTLKNGAVQTIQIGAPLPIGGSYYAKLKNSPIVYKVGDGGLQGLGLAPFDFMQKLPIVTPFNDVWSVMVSWNGATKTIIKIDPAKTSSESAWKFEGREFTGSEATAFLDKVILMSTEELVKSSSEVNQDNPELKLDIKLKKDGADTNQTYVGKVVGESVWIIKQGDAWAYSIPTATVQEMFDSLK